MGLQKGDYLFLIIHKDQQAANTIFLFWPVLSFLKGLQNVGGSILLVLLFWGQMTTGGLSVGLQMDYWQNDVLFWYPHSNE